MACPYFYPLHPNAAPQALPLPLGDSWEGVCRAGQGPPAEPDPTQIRSLCQLGYARGACGRFPVHDPGPDAVRFAITAVTAPSLQLSYVLERDHHPFAHGSLSYSFAAGRFLQGPEDSSLPEIAARQAEAYVESYLRRQPEPSSR
jgi:hypothetical protein